MAGILDFLQTPDAQLGIGLLAAGGYSPTPMTAGQRIAGALGSFQAQQAALQDTKMKRQLMQSQIDEKVGRTFSVLLRAFMRHDPDVILIGETRDEESAKTAINAALTGHRVFSTLHTNDAAGTVARLGEFGIEPFLISSAVKGVCATRLVQRLCMSCRQKPNPATHEFLTKEYGEGDYYEPQGCPKCAGTGFLGRLAILEVFPLSDDSDPVTQKLILERAPMAELKRHLAGKYGSMRLDGIAKARRGITTIQEVLSQV